MRTLFLGQTLKSVDARTACRVLVTPEFNVTAQRNGAKLPARAMLVGKARQFGTKANGESGRTNAAPASDEIVAHLMHEHQNDQHKQEGHDVAGNQADDGHAILQLSA